MNHKYPTNINTPLSRITPQARISITEPFDFGSMCSGMEAATAAWESLGMLAAWLVEVEPFPSAVLADHYPHAHLHQRAYDGPAKAEAVADDDVQLPWLRCWCRRKRIHVETLGTVGFRPIATLGARPLTAMSGHSLTTVF